ncbi:hypothetical protein CEUSTIGMA_g8094.t1 [Chlamydomonas eustigma]|uniref:Trafficking protein particle complex subunit n=1 Tax=Chlamydomonas eustigma TaxID=1157962 RepID=A0A250XCP3_9CHLO|nr:hypothetical protein CEUSTIGMA_g8094.t1 [Chlamydomonas eustigma]|eukprot:GAX80659.1 hypothetical protein CEUSTIGMA_g8094.t1 [Chlamydomonas eustigma]
MAGRPKQALNIVDRPLSKNKLELSTVSVSAFAFLTSEIIQYTMDNASNTTDLDERLDRIGYEVGVRNMELLSFREKVPRRKPEVLDALRFIHSTAWPHMFGKTADDLQQAAAADDEYMISDHDLPTNRYVSVPKSYGSFNPGGLVAGIIRGMLGTAGFPARVSAHFVESRDRPKPTTTFLIKLDTLVMQREALVKQQR